MVKVHVAINEGIVYMYIKLLMFYTVVATKENRTSDKAFKALRNVLHLNSRKKYRPAVEERVVQLIIMVKFLANLCR